MAANKQVYEICPRILSQTNYIKLFENFEIKRQEKIRTKKNVIV